MSSPKYQKVLAQKTIFDSFDILFNKAQCDVLLWSHSEHAGSFFSIWSRVSVWIWCVECHTYVYVSADADLWSFLKAQAQVFTSGFEKFKLYNYLESVTSDDSWADRRGVMLCFCSVTASQLRFKKAFKRRFIRGLPVEYAIRHADRAVLKKRLVFRLFFKRDCF